jgi:hypothetical protein
VKIAVGSLNVLIKCNSGLVELPLVDNEYSLSTIRRNYSSKNINLKIWSAFQYISEIVDSSDSIELIINEKDAGTKYILFANSDCHFKKTHGYFRKVPSATVLEIIKSAHVISRGNGYIEYADRSKNTNKLEVTLFDKTRLYAKCKNDNNATIIKSYGNSKAYLEYYAGDCQVTGYNNSELFVGVKKENWYSSPTTTCRIQSNDMCSIKKIINPKFDDILYPKYNINF